MADEQIQPEEPRRERRDRIREDAADEDRPRRRRRRDEDEDEDDRGRFRKPDAVETLIPYRNPRGLIAYYLGVFSLIPCLGLVLGPAALILGFMGLGYRKRHPTAGGTGHAITGIVLGAITTLGNWGAVIAFLVALLLSK
jgi:hypothetical protein